MSRLAIFASRLQLADTENPLETISVTPTEDTESDIESTTTSVENNSTDDSQEPCGGRLIYFSSAGSAPVVKSSIDSSVVPQEIGAAIPSPRSAPMYVCHGVRRES